MEPPDPDYILRGFEAPVTSLVFLPNCWDDRSCDGAAYLVAGTQSGSLLVWNLKTRRVIHRMMSTHANSVLSLTVLDGCEVLSQGREGVVIRWKLLAVDNWIKIGGICCHFLICCFCLNTNWNYSRSNDNVLWHETKAILCLLCKVHI